MHIPLTGCVPLDSVLLRREVAGLPPLRLQKILLGSRDHQTNNF